MELLLDLDILYKVTEGYSNKYSAGNELFKITTRLLEECGELAKKVNHFDWSKNPKIW